MLTLQSPNRDLYKAFMEMSSDYARTGENRYQRTEGWNPRSFNSYIKELDDQSKGINLPPNWSPHSTFWLIEDEMCIVGVVRIRMLLNENLLKEGGNIGYDVPPSKRKNGYGTELLRQAIIKAKEMGLVKLLITCDKDNIASRNIIEKNNGILEGEGISEESGKAILRYWITDPAGGRPSPIEKQPSLT